MLINNGELRKIENTAQFLLDTGLLFEINRRVLHPYGLALEIITDNETGKAIKIGKLWDYRDDPEGMLFAPETFEVGLEKWSKFERENKDRVRKRLTLLGFLIQSEAEIKPIKRSE